MDRYPPIVPGFPHMLHGGDYNPDQWLDCPEVLDEDYRLALEARINTFSIGIFAWAALEPEEGHFEFGWLDETMDRMAAQGMKAMLATPSGAKPNWMAKKYPEIRRISEDGHRDKQGGRHNHCLTSPIYREKVALINGKLAERYAGHPALGAWHLSNEYSGECRCELCKEAFRQWLKEKYTTLDALNHAWWTRFWAHTYTDWAQIDKVDGCVHGHVLDWRRFCSDQTASFVCNEIVPLRHFTPEVPVTTNLMGRFFGLDSRRIAAHLDFVSWDNYPKFHDRADMASVGAEIGFTHDLTRGLKHGRPFLLMESSPSATNWMPVNKLLRPGVHRLKSLQAVAHGADSVQYFQYRKSRGSAEKFHGAVIDHVGHERTRVFGDVAEIGQILAKLDGLVGAVTPAEVAIVYDWENRWVLEEVAGPPKLIHDDWVIDQYRAFWQRGIPVDIIGADDPVDRYKLVIAPMLYLIRPGVAERLDAFVQAGGTLVGTFLTGIADQNDLVFLGGWPGPLRPTFGIWAEEIDYLYQDEGNRLIPHADKLPAMAAEYPVRIACDLIHAETAEVLATYGDDFYAGRPCLTVNRHGAGKAYYLAARASAGFLSDWYGAMAADLDLARALPGDLPAGVTAQVRTTGDARYVFLLNFNREPANVGLSGERFTDVLTGQPAGNSVALAGYGSAILMQG